MERRHCDKCDFGGALEIMWRFLQATHFVPQAASFVYDVK